MKGGFVLKANRMRTNQLTAIFRAKNSFLSKAGGTKPYATSWHMCAFAERVSRAYKIEVDQELQTYAKTPLLCRSRENKRVAAASSVESFA